MIIARIMNYEGWVKEKTALQYKIYFYYDEL